MTLLDKIQVTREAFPAMDTAPRSPEETAMFQVTFNERGTTKDNLLMKNALEVDSLVEGPDQATVVVVDSMPNVQIIGGSPRQGMSHTRMHDITNGHGHPMSDDERMEVATRARLGGKSSILLTQLAAMSMAMMPDLFQASAITGTTRTRVGGFFGGTDPQRRAYDVNEESKLLAKQIDEAEIAEVAMTKAELKRQRRMERNLRNVQGNS